MKPNSILRTPAGALAGTPPRGPAWERSQMSSSGRKGRWYATLSVLVTMLVGSSSLGVADHNLVAQEPELRPWAHGPLMGAILDATSGEDVLLSRVWGMSVDSEGRVYVKDDGTRGVIVLRPDLTYERTLGRGGEGPGEFRHVSTVQVLPGDSVFVYDRRLNRITVFGPGSGEPAHVHTRPGVPYQSIFRVSEGFVAVQSPTYQASGSDIGVETDWLLRLREDGSVADSLFSFPKKENLVYRTSDPRGGGAVSISDHPFGHEPFVQVFDGDSLRAVYASSRALDVRTINVETGIQTSFSYPTTPIEVTRDELGFEADERSSGFARMLRDGVPYTWPPLTGIVAGDAGLVYVGIRRTDGAIWEWAMFRSDGHHIMSIALPAGFVVYAVWGGRLIGSITDEFDVPRIRAYRMATDTLGALREH